MIIKVQCIFGHVLSSKIQISLNIRAVGSESSLGAFWMTKNAKFLCEQQRLRSDCAGWFESSVGGTCQKVLFLTLRHIWTRSENEIWDFIVKDPLKRSRISVWIIRCMQSRNAVSSWRHRDVIQRCLLWLLLLAVQEPPLCGTILVRKEQ